eukprot:7512822-Pyramimonas_sp.AAC.2
MPSPVSFRALRTTRVTSLNTSNVLKRTNMFRSDDDGHRHGDARGCVSLSEVIPTRGPHTNVPRRGPSRHRAAVR